MNVRHFKTLRRYRPLKQSPQKAHHHHSCESKAFIPNLLNFCNVSTFHQGFCLILQASHLLKPFYFMPRCVPSLRKNLIQSALENLSFYFCASVVRFNHSAAFLHR